MTRAELELEIMDVMGSDVFIALNRCQTGLPRMLEMAVTKRFGQIQVETRGDVILQDAWVGLRDTGEFEFDDEKGTDADTEFDEFQDFIVNNRRSWET